MVSRKPRRSEGSISQSRVITPFGPDYMRFIRELLCFVMFISLKCCALRVPVRFRTISAAAAPRNLDTLPSIIVKNDKLKHFEKGYPLVYVDAITKLVGNPQAGKDVLVKDSSGSVVARGFYNPHSMFRVRMVAMKDDPHFNAEMSNLIQVRIKQAMALRRSLLLPRDGTNVYRLVNCEGDFLSGLIIDVLGSSVVIQSSAVWVELQREHIESALSSLPELKDKSMIWRRSEDRLQKDGIDELVRTDSLTTEKAILGDKDATISVSTSVANEVVTENGLKYSIDPIGGQKTGFYCDQRDNRLYLRSVSAGKTVLDLYCYSGGFSMNALRGGARSVTAVDSSLKAMESVRENMILNGFDAQYAMKQTGFADSVDSLPVVELSSETNAKIALGGTEAGVATVADTQHSAVPVSIPDGTIELVKGEAERVMKALLEQGKQFDIVICDPPKLAPTRTSLHRAVRKYAKINAMAMQLVDAKQGGLLLTCTCSAAMTQSEQFVEMLQDAAQAAGRKITVLRTANAAPDHTVAAAYPEGRYFTSVLLYVQ